MPRAILLAAVFSLSSPLLGSTTCMPAPPASARVPKRPGEFVCQSCFLVKHPSQLADGKRMLCRDCV